MGRTRQCEATSLNITKNEMFKWAKNIEIFEWPFVSYFNHHSMMETKGVPPYTLPALRTFELIHSLLLSAYLPFVFERSDAYHSKITYAHIQTIVLIWQRSRAHIKFCCSFLLLASFVSSFLSTIYACCCCWCWFFFSFAHMCIGTHILFWETLRVSRTKPTHIIQHGGPN